MGEGINLFGLNQINIDAKRQAELHEKFSRKLKPHSQSETINRGNIIGRVVSMKAKRKNVDVKITSDSLSHIRHDIERGYVPFDVADIEKLPQYMANAEYQNPAEADKNGRHQKPNKVSYSYYKFDYNGTTLYLNIKNTKIVNKSGRNFTKRELYNITKKIKNPK